jgi:O-antigen/teichoic acid export membrane protein
MTQRYAIVARNAAYLFVGTLAGKLIAAGANILYGRHAGANDYGQLSVGIAFAAIGAFIVDMGLTQTAVREGTKPGADVDRIMSTVVVVKTLLTVVAFLVLPGVMWLIYGAGDLFWVVTIITLSTILGTFLQGFAVLHGQMVQDMRVLSLLSLALSVGNSLALVIGSWLSLPIVWVAWLYGLSSVVAGIVCLLPRRARWSWSRERDWAVVSDLPSYAVNGTIAILTAQIIPVLTERMLSSAEAGVYTAASKFPAMLFQFPAMLITAFFPMLFALGHSEADLAAHSRAVVEELRSILMCSFVLAAPFVYFGPELVTFLFGEPYASGGIAMVLSGLWLIAQSVKTVFADAIMTRGGVKARIIITAASLGVMIGAFVLLIPRFGVTGAALAPLLGEVLTAVLCLAVYRRGVGSGTWILLTHGAIFGLAWAAGHWLPFPLLVDIVVAEAVLVLLVLALDFRSARRLVDLLIRSRRGGQADVEPEMPA